MLCEIQLIVHIGLYHFKRNYLTLSFGGKGGGTVSHLNLFSAATLPIMKS